MINIITGRTQYILDMLELIILYSEYQLLLSFLDSPDPSTRRVAIEAPGKIGTANIVGPMVARYRKEQDFGHRLAVVEALVRVGEAGNIRAALESLKTDEANPFLRSILSNRLTSLRSE